MGLWISPLVTRNQTFGNPNPRETPRFAGIIYSASINLSTVNRSASVRPLHLLDILSMSAHIMTSRLTALPFPLLPAERGRDSALAHIARAQSDLLGTASLSDPLTSLSPEAVHRARQLVHTAAQEGMDSREFSQFVAQEKLVHLHHGVYLSPRTQLSPLIRALSCEIILPAGLLHRVRLSRRAAAWVLGYGQLPPPAP